jgi:hypothetical protein
MTNDHFRRHRRFRRLFPAAVAAVTIAASAPFAATAHAETPKPTRRHDVHATPPGKIGALMAVKSSPDPRVQGNSAT